MGSRLKLLYRLKNGFNMNMILWRGLFNEDIWKD
jgi:hypothetical protein